MLFKWVKVVCVLLIVQFTLTGCTSLISTKNLTNFNDKSIPDLIENGYIKTTEIAGFTYHEPDIYTTRWILNIYELFDWELTNKSSITEWVNNIDVTEISELAKKDENYVLDFVNLKKELGLDFKKSEKEELLKSVYENTTDSYINSRFQISDLLEVDIKEKEAMKSYIKNKIKDSTNKNDRVNYYHLLMQIDKSDTSINKKEISKLDIPILDNELDAYDIHSLYNEMRLKEENNIPFKHSISEQEIHELVTKFVKFDSNMTPQILYKFLYITKDIASSDDIETLEEFFSSFSLENGWFILNQTLGVIPTYYGLITTDYLSDINNLDKRLISNYLNAELKQLTENKSLNSLQIIQLGYILKSLRILNDFSWIESTEKIVEYNLSEITEKSNLEEEDIKSLLLLMEISISEKFNKVHIDKKIKNNIEENIKVLRKIDKIYYSVLLAKYTDEKTTNATEIKIELEGYQEEDGSFKSDEQSDAISDTQNVIKTYKLLGEELSREEDVIIFLNKKLDTIKNNDNFTNIIYNGIICESLKGIEG